MSTSVHVTRKSFRIVHVLAFFLLLALPALHAEEQAAEGAASPDVVPDHGIYYLEIVTPDAGAMRDFYREAFGYEFSEGTPELGGAYFATLPGGSLLGIRGPLRPTEEPILRNYLKVEDIHRATKRAEELGAEIALGPTEIAGRGQIAIYLLGGIEQGIWQVP